jgi:transporter family-2 protein
MLQLLNLAGAMAIGASFALYLPMLSQTGKIVGSPALANIPFFLIGAAISTAAFLFTAKPSAIARLGDVPPWMFLAGVVSGFVILGTAVLIPRIGPSPFFVLVVAGQVVMGAVMSHFGIFGTPVDPVSFKQLAGIALVIGGAYLVAIR